MSSTYVHYSTPSSLPSDYALLSRYAAAHRAQDVQNTDDRNDSEHVFSDHDSVPDAHPHGLAIPNASSPVSRRRSFPTSYITPFKPTMGPLPDSSGYRSGPPDPNASETTPLLTPYVPRIEEEVDRIDRNDVARPVSMLREELAILLKYTLPVFGYATTTPLRVCSLTRMHAELMSWSTPLSLHPSCH